MTEQPSDSGFTSHPALDELSEIVLAGVQRLGSLQGFPVTDAALVGETDLDGDKIREILRDNLAGRHLELAPGEREGSVEVVGLVGQQENPPSESNLPA